MGASLHMCGLLGVCGRHTLGGTPWEAHLIGKHTCDLMVCKRWTPHFGGAGLPPEAKHIVTDKLFNIHSKS